MNKQELIERIEGLKNLFGNKVECIEIDAVIELVSKLDEPEKVKIPQFVAEHIEHSKEIGRDLQDAMNSSLINKQVDQWLYTKNNMETFAQAWIFGYEVEKEKRYLVKMLKANFGGKIQILSFRKNSFFWSSNWEGYKVHHTRKELEDADFGWVFDCPGIEIEEVE